MPKGHFTNEETAAVASYLGTILINDDDARREFAKAAKQSDSKKLIELIQQEVKDSLSWQVSDEGLAGGLTTAALKRVNYAEIAESHIKMARAGGRLQQQAEGQQLGR